MSKVTEFQYLIALLRGGLHGQPWGTLLLCHTFFPQLILNIDLKLGPSALAMQIVPKVPTKWATQLFILSSCKSKVPLETVCIPPLNHIFSYFLSQCYLIRPLGASKGVGAIRLIFDPKIKCLSNILKITKTNPEYKTFFKQMNNFSIFLNTVTSS